MDVESDSICVSIEDPANWIEARCNFMWNNEEKSISLQLQLESDKNDCWRWCIVGVDGLEDAHLLEEKGVLQISPVEHEINFIGLESLFQHNSVDFVKTKKRETKIDKLSYFYGLVFSGVLKYQNCETVEFHCKQIPGYYFIVSKVDRLTSTNSGWLISSIIKEPVQ